MQIIKRVKLIERPGFIGKRKKEIHDKWDKRFGKGNWTCVWKWGDLLINYWYACLIYEDAYYQDSFNREFLWKEIFSIARDFYDDSKTNINSKLNYNKQESSSTHIQDIAVRRVGLRRGWKPKGTILVQIRSPKSLGGKLSPGKVQFHVPELIEKPRIFPKWALPTSVECFYQSNKWLAVKE